MLGLYLLSCEYVDGITHERSSVNTKSSVYQLSTSQMVNVLLSSRVLALYKSNGRCSGLELLLLPSQISIIVQFPNIYQIYHRLSRSSCTYSGTTLSRSSTTELSTSQVITLPRLQLDKLLPFWMITAFIVHDCHMACSISDNCRKVQITLSKKHFKFSRSYTI